MSQTPELHKPLDKHLSPGRQWQSNEQEIPNLPSEHSVIP